MDLGTNLIFLVIFGLFGFLISNFWGINPYRIFSDLATAAIVVPLTFLIIKAAVNPENALEVVTEMVDFFVNNLPGIIIGDVAGSIVGAIVGAITGERQ